jgi:hypothetical protein
VGYLSVNYYTLCCGQVLLIKDLIAPVTKLLDKWIPDADTKQKLAHEISTMSDKYAQKLALAQIEVNREEAKGNWFQAGWRPATGWVCVAGFAVNFLISPLASAIGVTIPQADTSVMLPVLMGMLGLGTLRSYEKVKKNG